MDLVEAHGRSTGHMRYSQLWQSYSRFLEYVERTRLVLSKDSWNQFLSQTPDFNGKVFLDRLQRVLRKTSKQMDGHDNQQAILSQLHLIDWRHNGFYYASRYESFPYWQAGLKLSGLQPTSNELKAPGCQAPWPSRLQVQDSKTHALRFAAQRMRMSVAELAEIEKAVTQLPAEEKTGQILRVFTVCLAQGVDKLAQFSAEAAAQVFTKMNSRTPTGMTPLLDYINWMHPMDGKLLPNTLHLRFADLPVLADLLEQQKLNDSLTLELINACGRALQYFTGPDRQKKMMDLLNFARGEGLYHPALQTYPWLLNECKSPDELGVDDPYLVAKEQLPSTGFITLPTRLKNQMDILQQQLRTIDFSRSRTYPNKKQLTQAFQEIVTAKTVDEAARLRRDAVAGWVKAGCAIAFQDAQFRHLSKEEQRDAVANFVGHLKLNFRSTNKLLVQTLITENLLAIDTERGDAERQVKELFTLLIELDNKSHYNELGQVLGMLISNARQEKQNRFYSVPQLTQWLQSLMPEKKVYEKLHYPVDLLQEILSHNLRPDSDLLNSELQCLRSKASMEQEQVQRQIANLARAELPNQYKPDLVRVALRQPDKLRYVQSSQDLLKRLSDAAMDPQWLRLLSKAVVSRRRDPSGKLMLIWRSCPCAGARMPMWPSRPSWKNCGKTRRLN